MNAARVAIVVGILSLTGIGVVGCTTERPPSSPNTSHSNQTATNPSASASGGSANGSGVTNTATSNNSSSNTGAGSAPANNKTNSSSAPAQFPAIVTTAMQQFPSNLLPSAQAPTLLPTPISGSSQLHYRTWDTASGSILNYSVQFSSSHYRVATFMGSTYSGMSAGNAVTLPHALPANAHTVQQTVNLSAGIAAQGQTFVAAKDNAKEVSSATIRWTEGRWQIEVSQEGTQMPITEANLVASYLHSHFMPVPQSKGTIFVNVYPGENAQGQLVGTAVDETIKWQEGTHVYEIDTYSHAKSPIQTGLAMTISMKPYSG
jgi:hypothetical protein